MKLLELAQFGLNLYTLTFLFLNQAPYIMLNSRLTQRYPYYINNYDLFIIFFLYSQ